MKLKSMNGSHSSNTRRLVSVLAGVFLVLILSSCSTVVNSHRQKSSMMSSYLQGNNADVAKVIDEKLSSSLASSNDELMWRLESGAINFHQGKYKESTAQFKISEELIEKFDERAIVSMRDVGSEGASLLTNPNALPYRGFCRDRIAISIYKSLSYLGENRQDAFRAQIKRLRDAQKKIQEDYESFFTQEKEAMEKQKQKNANTAQTEEYSEESLTKNDQNAKLKQALEETGQIANRGYGNFLNPVAIFLSGLSNVFDDNYENALIDFKRIYEAMPANPVVQRYYVTALNKTGREIPADLQAVPPFDFDLSKECVYVIFGNGITASFKQIAIYFPIMTAWPVCEYHDAPFIGMEVQANGQNHTAAMLADMDGIISQEYRQRLPAMITRIVLSTAAKETGSALAKKYGGNYAYLAAKAFSAVMNTADTRSWELLPKQFQFTQFQTPVDGKISVNLTGNLSVNKEITLPSGCKSAIIFINAPSAANIACHVFPLDAE